MAVKEYLFTDALIRAIDDWQSGSRDKHRKAQVLRESSAHLPLHYREVPERAYRQVRTNAKLAVGIAVDAMPDAISSWATSLEVAQHFREHHRDHEKVMMIFGRHPASEDVILNLNAVYADPDFMDTVKAAEKRLGQKFKGIARWQDTQKEIILEETIVGNDDIISIGAFRQLSDLFPEIGDRDPNAPSDDEIYRELTGKSTDEHFWTSPESASEGVKNAAIKCRDFLKDKRLWPEGLPE